MVVDKSGSAEHCHHKACGFPADASNRRRLARVSSACGAEAIELIAAGRYGCMVAYQGSYVDAVKITEAVGRLKTVPPDGGFAHGAGLGNLSWELA